MALTNPQLPVVIVCFKATKSGEPNLIHYHY